VLSPLSLKILLKYRCKCLYKTKRKQFSISQNIEEWYRKINKVNVSSLLEYKFLLRYIDFFNIVKTKSSVF
jgi:hypothetical protein